MLEQILSTFLEPEFLRLAALNFLYLISGFGLIYFLFDNLTANNIPTNLRGYSQGILFKAIIMLVTLFLISISITYFMVY